MQQLDIESLYTFQQKYLFQVLKNIPKDKTYSKQLEGYNSAGWIMGHLCAEGADALQKLGYNPNTPKWLSLFTYNAPSLNSLDGLPTLKESKELFLSLYGELIVLYREMDLKQRESKPNSPLLAKLVPDQSSWLAHHLTTHIAVHIGNITVWKKIVGIPVQGY